MEAQRKTVETRDALKTIDDLASLPEGEKAELLGGEIVMMAPASFRHSRLVSGLTSILWNYCESQKIKGPKGPESWIVIAEAWTFYDRHNSFVHDLAAFIRSEVPLSIKGPVRSKPTWVCEILSPSNWYNDMNHKREMLEKHKVPYYWIVDPEKEMIQIFYLEESAKHYRILKIFGREDGEARLAPFNEMTINLKTLFGEDKE
ncbi:MAG: Uma2 family endonuclease [Deltaproteobacteria bacterium]|nr:Uma2 family endonuclease [Deltaproteobacteria bacterium]